MNIGTPELILILVIALVVFGPKRLPEIGRTIGRSLREFRRASQDLRDEFRVSLDDDELPATPSTGPTEAPPELHGDSSAAGAAPEPQGRKRPATKRPAPKRPAPRKRPATKRSG